MRAQRIEEEIFITNLIRQRYSPKKTDDLILATARQDGKDCWVRWEREPGSAGVRDSAHLNELLWGFDCHGVLSRTSKIQRAKPIARQAAIGKIKILRGAWNPVLFDAIDSFPSAGKDEIDAMCGAISQLPDVEELGSLYLEVYGI